MSEQAEIERAARAIREGDALLVGAGAGMGVDSGLPDFRGPEGFWRAYPAFREKGLRFEDMANPTWFETDPRLAWGFYGHRLQLYRDTIPHHGYELLLEWGSRMPGGYFVFTSNVDGHFSKAGFDTDRVLECHGSIHHLQCAGPCSPRIWGGENVSVAFDTDSFRADEPLPTCPRCGGVARPNIMMFGDWGWLSSRTDEQQARFRNWLASVDRGRLVVVECGAGTAVPTVRMTCDRVGGTLVRINPREPGLRGDGISLPMGAAGALQRIDAVLEGLE